MSTNPFSECVYPSETMHMAHHAAPTQWGLWRSRIYADFLPGKVPRIRLQRALSFQDADGVTHYVPAGFITDGATIPKWCWWLVGGPLTEQYLRAATLHDLQIDKKAEPWRAVHMRLYRALRADYVRFPIAALFSLAAMLRGPRW